MKFNSQTRCLPQNHLLNEDFKKNRTSYLDFIIIFFIFESSRYFNVIGSDPEGRLGEAPRPELREHGRISGACFDAARSIIPGLKVWLSIIN